MNRRGGRPSGRKPTGCRDNWAQGQLMASHLGARQVGPIPKQTGSGNNASLEDPTMNITEEALAKLKCTVCELPLSLGPVTITSDNKFVCGRCPAAASVNTIYEVLAENYLFPCRYQSYGCLDKIKWGSVKKHEETCLKRPYVCPALSCTWKGPVNDITAHFATEHCESVSSENLIAIKLDEDVECRNLIPTTHGNYILHYTVTPKVLQLALCELKNQSLFKTQKFQLKLSSLDFSKQIKYTGIQIKPYDLWCLTDHEEAVLKIDINSLITLTDDNSVFCEIIFHKEKLKIHEILLDTFECEICNEIMSPPIGMCNTGHSFCLSCISKMRYCLLCEDDFNDIRRNYTLEHLAEEPIFSCKNVGFGCMYRDSCKNIKNHENQCLVTNFCPEVKALLRLSFLHNQL